MGFFSSRIELNNTIKSLKSEVEKLKSETTIKSEQITELNKKISSLSQKNAEYEKKYINTNLECEFCYTTLQKEFVFESMISGHLQNWGMFRNHSQPLAVMFYSSPQP